MRAWGPAVINLPMLVKLVSLRSFLITEAIGMVQGPVQSTSPLRPASSETSERRWPQAHTVANASISFDKFPVGVPFDRLCLHCSAAACRRVLS